MVEDVTGGVQPARGVLVLAGAPIGRPADASPRLAEELASADVVAAEDTRRLRRLAGDLGISVGEEGQRVVSYFEGNEHARTQGLLEALDDGARVVVITDAGMPSVSDPGYRLVVAAVAAGVRVTAVPGPSAVLTALAVSGLPVDRFCFEGFLPRRAGERSRRLAELAAEPRTMVFFEAPHRTGTALAALAEVFGADRPAAVCRELTKTHEEVVRGPLAELVQWAEAGVRGEVTLVVGGGTGLTGRRPEAGGPGDAAVVAGPEELAALVAAEEASGVSRADAVRAVARRHGLRRREVYAAAHRSVHPQGHTGRAGGAATGGPGGPGGPVG